MERWLAERWLGQVDSLHRIEEVVWLRTCRGCLVDSLHGLGEVAWRRISTHDAYVAIVPLLRPDAMR